MPWSAPFQDPIATEGKPLVTLSDAARYLMWVPPSERRSREWLAAVEAVLLAAEAAGPVMNARVGMLRLLIALGRKGHQITPPPPPI